MPGDNGNNIEDGQALAESLQSRCQKLLQELEEFRSFIDERKAEHEHTVDIKKFQTSVHTEYKSLQKLGESDLTAEKTIHTLRSSNLPFYAATWNAAKASRALTAFHKRFYWEERPTRESKKAAERRCALVDIVACDGEEWIKVSTITEERLKFEIAKAEWEAANYSSDEEADEHGAQVNGSTDGNPTTTLGNDLDRIELVQTADDFLRASRSHRIHYQHPQVRFILPKISTNPPPELLPVLDRIRSTGAIIDLGPQTANPQDPRETVFAILLPSPHPPLTPTLNIDCTILLALVSDLSHTANHPILPGYNAAITRQIELETRDNLLPSRLWPAMAGKDLLCTEEAANRMKEIVDTIGTSRERSRTELLLPNENYSHEDNGWEEPLRQEFAKYSDYPIPPTWRLPIRIDIAKVTDHDISSAINSDVLPPVAKQVAEQLTDINRSVFMHGWIRGITTVSSNRTVTKLIEAVVEKSGEGAKGPDIWLREPARSLLGKEKERRK